VTFTLANTPISSGIVNVYLDGIRTSQYTISGATITMSSAPKYGQNILVDYAY
jgi:hypothetical protein